MMARDALLAYLVEQGVRKPVGCSLLRSPRATRSGVAQGICD
jgi:hypothetical protein